MRKPEYNEQWPEIIKALFRHDQAEMWDRSIMTNVFNCYHSELERYFRIAGQGPLKILDVGCAQGTLALLLAERGHQVVAVDLRPEFLDYAQSRYETGDIRFVQGNAMELDFQEKFDLIFANQILEHLVYPVELVRGLSDMLAPGGRLVCTTPNGRYFTSKLPLFHELGDPSQYEDQQFFPDGDGHFFSYSRGELQEVFTDAGLVDMSVVPYSTPWITGHAKCRFLHGWVPLIMLAMLDKGTLALPGVRWKMAFQLMVSGRKNDE